MGVVRWFHLIGASIWVGGLFAMGGIANGLRRAGADRSLLQAAARAFGQVQWVGFGLAFLSGAWMAMDFIDRPLLAVKMALVFLAAGLAVWHQFAAANQSPKMRGILQVVILLVSLGIVAAAVAL